MSHQLGWVCFDCAFDLSNKEYQKQVEEEDNENCPCCDGMMMQEEPEEGYESSPNTRYDRTGKRVEDKEDHDEDE